MTVQVSRRHARTDTQAIAVTVTSANDNTPVITSDGGGATAGVSVAENRPRSRSVTAGDADLPAQTLSYSIVGGADAALFSIDAGTGVLSFNAAPDYEAPADVGANNVYDVTVQVADGAGSTDTQAISVTVTSANAPPVIAGLNGDSLAYAEGDGAVVVEQSGDASVADLDSTNFDTGTLTVSFVAGSDSAEDVLAIRNQGSGAGQIGIAGSNMTYGGTTIGSFAGGSGGADLVVTFNANATPAAAQALIRNITYQNTDSDAPTTGARTVRFVLTDGDGGSSGDHFATVTVSGVNDAPAITSNGGGATRRRQRGGEHDRCHRGDQRRCRRWRSRPTASAAAPMPRASRSAAARVR